MPTMLSSLICLTELLTSVKADQATAPAIPVNIVIPPKARNNLALMPKVAFLLS